MRAILGDVQYGLRGFRRTPGFAVPGLLVLALGIGATAGIFSLLDQVLLRPLPVSEPDRLVQVEWRGDTTGLYALMSMTMAQRRRELGIRLALGGSTRAVMVTVARRALMQIGIGVTWGAGVWVALMSSVLKSCSRNRGCEDARAMALRASGIGGGRHCDRAGRRAEADAAVRPHAAR